jgi:uncharacterized protein YdaU (DUF1376 family)
MTDDHLQANCAEGKQNSEKSTREFAGYKRYPQAYLNGTRRLSIAARGAYGDLLDLMFLEGGGLPDDNPYIACSLHITQRHWLKLRKELFEAKKLFVGADGLIHNRRADDEIEDRFEAQNRPKVGPANRRKFNVINGGRSTDLELEEEVEKESSSISPKGLDEEEKRKPLQLSPSVVDELHSVVGQRRADELVGIYLRSKHARDAVWLDDAFRGWLAKRGIPITCKGDAAFRPADAHALCPKDEHGRPNTKLPRTVRNDFDWRAHARKGRAR